MGDKQLVTSRACRTGPEAKKRALFFRLQCPVLKLKRGPVSKPPVTVASQHRQISNLGLNVFSVLLCLEIHELKVCGAGQCTTKAGKTRILHRPK